MGQICKLGKCFSAISNEATLKNRQYAWIFFGIDDKTHTFTNIRYHYDNNFNNVKKQISDNTTDNVIFIEIYNLDIEYNRAIMFQVPAASGTPMNWKEFPNEVDQYDNYILCELINNCIVSTKYRKCFERWIFFPILQKSIFGQCYG